MDMSRNPEPQPVCYSELQHYLTCKLFFWLSSSFLPFFSAGLQLQALRLLGRIAQHWSRHFARMPYKSGFYNQLGR